MRAMVLPKIVSLDNTDEPLRLVDLPMPSPGDNEVLIKVSVCGVCHTELDEIEGRAAPPDLPIVLGHEVVGMVEALGKGVTMLHPGDRVGVGWIHHSSGEQDENLSSQFRATGRDVNGGYAEYMTVPENYACLIPDAINDQQAAPLLCAGAIGYRALKLCAMSDGDTLGLTGFGGSAHLVLQLARFIYPASRVFVFARDTSARKFAHDLGADWVGGTMDKSPVAIKAVIDTTPAWMPVIQALNNLQPSGRLVINAIRKQDDDKHCLLELSYHKHLWMEKEIKTVANITHQDITEFLKIAAEIPIAPRVTAYALEQANQALMELKHNTVKGAKVLVINPSN